MPIIMKVHCAKISMIIIQSINQCKSIKINNLLLLLYHLKIIINNFNFTIISQTKLQSHKINIMSTPSNLIQASKANSSLRRKSSILESGSLIDYVSIITRANNDLHEYLFNINEAFKKVIQNRQSQYLIAFKKHSEQVEKQLIKLRDQFMKKKPDQSNQQIILMLQKQTALFRQQAIRTYYKLQQKQEQLKEVKFKLQITQDQLRYSQNTRKQLMKKLKSQSISRSSQFELNQNNQQHKKMNRINIKTQPSDQSLKNRQITSQIIKTQRSLNPQKSIIDRLYTSKYCPNKTSRSKGTSNNFFNSNNKNTKSYMNIFFTDFEQAQKDNSQYIRANSFFDDKNLQKLRKIFKQLVQLKASFHQKQQKAETQVIKKDELFNLVKRIILNKQNYKQFQKFFFSLKHIPVEEQVNNQILIDNFSGFKTTKDKKVNNQKILEGQLQMSSRPNLRFILKKEQIKKGKLSARDFGKWIKSNQQ